VKEPPPTIFHVTHWKAGSQWVAGILKQSAPERFVSWKTVSASANRGAGTANFYTEPLKPGTIYGTVYTPRAIFTKLVFGLFWRSQKGPYQKETYLFIHPSRALRNWWNFGIKRNPCKTFVVIRDIRDTLVSLYFSTKHSHPLEVDAMVTRRNMLNELGEEDGLIYMMDEALWAVAEIQSSWIKTSDALLFRYEEIINNEIAFFESLIEYCEIEVERETLHNIIKYNAFRSVVGRERGEEDPRSHYRKGVAGDWKNHFTDKVKDEFKKKYGQLLVDTGYENDLSW